VEGDRKNWNKEIRKDMWKEKEKIGIRRSGRICGRRQKKINRKINMKSA
jgi:hypothetical protein